MHPLDFKLAGIWQTEPDVTFGELPLLVIPLIISIAFMAEIYSYWFEFPAIKPTKTIGASASNILGQNSSPPMKKPTNNGIKRSPFA